MARTPSTMLDLGTSAPDFDLPDVLTGRHVSLRAFSDEKALLVMFICNHCPFVIHLAEGLSDLAADYKGDGLGIVAISSNDISTHPDDAPEMMVETAKRFGWAFPYLYDETQGVAKAYRAACTPDFFLFDADRELVYRGQFDTSRPGNGMPVTGKDLRWAIDAVLAGQPVSPDQKPSIGCNIKWKSGNQPDYYAH